MKKLAVLLFAFSAIVNAQSYKCVVNNITSYQATQCANGHEEKINIDIPAPVQDSETETPSNLDFIVGKLDIKKGKVSSDGTHSHFSPRVQVTNNTAESKKMYLTYQGIDGEGFAIDRFSIGGTIEPHSTRYFTNETWSETEKLNRIVKWQLDK